MRHIFAGGDLYIVIKTYGDRHAMMLVNSGEMDRTINPFQIKMFLTGAKEIVNLKSNKKIKLVNGESITAKGLTAEIFLLKQ
jgi:hypothetical protein